MGVIFRNNFDFDSFRTPTNPTAYYVPGQDPWTYTGPGVLAPIGCDGTRCLSCSHGTSNFFEGVQALLPVVHAQGAIRLQFATLFLNFGPPVGLYNFVLVSLRCATPAPSEVGSEAFTLHLTSDGAFQIESPAFAASVPSNVFAAAPSDGVWRALQFTFVITQAPNGIVPGQFDNILNAAVYLDNVLAANWINLTISAFNYGGNQRPGNIDAFWVHGWESVFADTFPLYKAMAIDSVEADDVGAPAVFPVCLADTLTINSCSPPVPPPPAPPCACPPFTIGDAGGLGALGGGGGSSGGDSLGDEGSENVSVQTRFTTHQTLQPNGSGAQALTITDEAIGAIVISVQGSIRWLCTGEAPTDSDGHLATDTVFQIVGHANILNFQCEASDQGNGSAIVVVSIARP